MATFLMYGKYSADAIKKISAERTAKAAKLVESHGGKIEAMYATLGEHDLVLVVSLPSVEDAMKTSIALAKMTGIAFATAPAVPVEQFDQLTG